MLTSSNPHKTKEFRTPPVPMVTRNTRSNLILETRGKALHVVVNAWREVGISTCCR